MAKINKAETPLFKTPVRTLRPEEIAQVSGGLSSNSIDGKPSATPVDVQGFR